MFSLNTYKAIEWCAFRRVPFVAYIERGEKKGHFFSAPSILNAPLEGAPEEGFFIGQFNQKSPDYLWIPFELNGEETCKRRMSLPDNSTLPDPPSRPDTDREEYIDEVSQLIRELKELGGGKVVISRIKTEYYVSKNFVDMMENLFASSPNCFCYCFYHPTVGFWMGATPELLFFQDAKETAFLTMALAGTVGVNDEWDEKNIEEQDIVAGDICSNLEEIGLQPMAMEEFDVTYGSIKHRCTPITADCKDKTSFEIIDAINPTAALCGFPRKGALEAILQIEHHPRSCYGGVVGFKTKRTIEAYVNIRCVNFNKSRFTFYAGGGIMPDSVAEDEWEETNKKIGNLKKRMLTD